MNILSKKIGIFAPARVNLLCMSQIITNFEVKFEIRGISDENEAGNILYELRSRLYLESASALDN